MVFFFSNRFSSIYMYDLEALIAESWLMSRQCLELCFFFLNLVILNLICILSLSEKVVEILQFCQYNALMLRLPDILIGINGHFKS